MPTSATGNEHTTGRALNRRAARRAGGFTFIEVLVVIVLLGLLVSLAVLSLPDRSPAEQLRREASRLFARMDLAREEAVLQVKTLGLRVEARGYHFLQLDRGGWRPLDDDRLLPARELPGDIRLTAELEGIEVSLGADPGDPGEDAPSPPQIFFLASGEILPDFRLYLVDPDAEVDFQIAPGDEQWLELTDTRD